MLELLFHDDKERNRVREDWFGNRIFHAVFAKTREGGKEVARLFPAKFPHMGVAKNMSGYEILGGARLSQSTQEWGQFSLDWVNPHLLQESVEQKRLMSETREALQTLFENVEPLFPAAHPNSPIIAVRSSSHSPVQEARQAAE